MPPLIIRPLHKYQVCKDNSKIEILVLKRGLRLVS